MSRGTDSGAVTAAAAPHVNAFPLVEMQLDSGTLRLAGVGFDVPWSGQTWQAVLGLGRIEPITETDSDVRGLAFELSGLPPSIIATVLDEKIQGRTVIVRNAFIDASNSVQVDANVWTGELDQMVMLDRARPTVRVTAENVMSTWEAPRLLMFSAEDQRRINSADKFFKYAARMTEQTIVWPNKSFFKR